MKKNNTIQNKILLILIIALITLQTGFSQKKDSTQINKARLNAVYYGGSALYAGSLTGLSIAWYKDQGMGSFHFFNDNLEWNQLDKGGHSYSAYQISKMGTETFKWVGLDDKKAHIYGSVLGLIYLTPIEILDGFSVTYGASWGDLGANFLGSSFWLGQYLLWGEERIHLKYSFHPTKYAPLRPNVLGDGIFQEWLKDYNGITLWLSFDMYSLLGQNEYIPKWLNLSFGYGADAMLSAHEHTNIEMGYHSYRQYYMSLDIDLSHIKTKNKFLNTLLFFVDMIKIPTPTIEYNRQDGWKFHPLYF